jgi:hypothetical protein
MSQKYITIEEGEDYRTIASKMTSLGYKMNHATARNILLSGMRNFMQNMSEEVDNFLTEDQVEELVMRQDIHEILGDILPLCVNEEKQLCPVETQQ